MLQMDDASIGYCIFVPTTRNKLWKHNLTTARVQTCLQHSFNNFLFFHCVQTIKTLNLFPILIQHQH